MAALAQSTNASKEDVNVITGSTQIRDLRDVSHVDSLFKNSLTRQHFFIHPDWNSEMLTKNKREPLARPCWAWEQQRHNPNVQFPFTYTMPSYGQKEPVEQAPIPYRLQIGNQGQVTPTASQEELTSAVGNLREIAPTTPQAELTYAVKNSGYYMKAEVPRDTEPECFTKNDTEDFKRLTTTMQERERLQFHLHY